MPPSKTHYNISPARCWVQLVEAPLQTVGHYHYIWRRTAGFGGELLGIGLADNPWNKTSHRADKAHRTNVGTDGVKPKYTPTTSLCRGITRRSENDSTLGRPRSENANISWVWPFHTVIWFMINCIMPPNFRRYCDFLAQAYHGKFQSSVKHAKIGWARLF